MNSWIILNIISAIRAGFHLKCPLDMIYNETKRNTFNMLLWAHTFWMLPLKGLRIPEFFFTAS